MPADEDTGTLNRVTVGIWHRESARQNIKTLLVTKSKFFSYVHQGTSGIGRDGIRSPLFVLSRITPQGKPQNSSYPVDGFVSFPNINIRFLHCAVFTNKIVRQLFLRFVEENKLWSVWNTIPVESRCDPVENGFWKGICTEWYTRNVAWSKGHLQKPWTRESCSRVHGRQCSLVPATARETSLKFVLSANVETSPTTVL